MVISLALHGLFFGILALTPARQILLEAAGRRKSSPAVNADRIEQIVDHVRDREREELSSRITELLYIEDQMQSIHDFKLDQYEILSADMALDAPQQALLALQKVLPAQQKALEAENLAADNQQHKSRLAIDHYHRVGFDMTRENQTAVEVANRLVAGRQDDASKAQATASDAQQTADRSLYFATEAFKPAKAALDAAIEAQNAANHAQEVATNLQTDLDEFYRRDLPQALRDVRDANGRLDRALDQTDRRQGEFDRAQANTDRAKEELDKARSEFQQRSAELEQARADLASAEDALKQEDSSENKKALDKAKRQLSSVEKRAFDAEKRVADRRKRLEDEKRRLAEANGRLDDERARIKPAREQLTVASSVLRQTREKSAEILAATESAQKDAVVVQKAAMESQSKAVDTLRTAIADAAKSDYEIIPDVNAPRYESSYDRYAFTLYDRNLAELYDIAMATETRIADTHKQIKAANTAVEGVMPMDIAVSQTMVARSPRPELNRELLTSPVRTGAAAARHRDEVTRLQQEVGSMVSGAYQRLSESQGMAPGYGDPGMIGVSLAEIRAAAEAAADLKAGALEDEDARYKDVSGLMQGAGPGQGPPTGGGLPRMGAGAAPGSGMPSTSPGKGRFAGYDPFAHLPRSADMRTLAATRFQVAPKRGVKTDKWSYVDTWYTIGPFPNPSRRNIDTKFPPESVVDLDAVYRGVDNRPIRWKFIKSPGIMIVPPDVAEYTIAYAYTELYFDQPCDRLIAVGSDDNSRIWVNGRLVWMSGRELKSWRADEGFRRVHFDKGVNKVLCRIENGWHSSMFSFMIHLGPETDQATTQQGG